MGNIMYSKDEVNISINFFVYSYFEITKNDISKDIIIRKAGKRAYLDLCRTIRSDRFKKMSAEEKNNLKEKVLDILVDAVNEFEKAADCGSIEMGQYKFDEIHKDYCEQIIGVYNEIGFNYGQAQKWLNMTLKYVIILSEVGIIKNLKNIRPFLHVPVDRYIIKAAKTNDKAESYGLGIADISSKNWSAWKYEDYIDFQNKIRDKIRNNGSLSEGYTPFYWENEAWIAVAEKTQNNR